MRALITGATGFLGGHLAPALTARGWEALALVRDPSSPSAERLRARGVAVSATMDAESTVAQVTRAQPDVVFHLATHYLRSHSPADISPLIRSNVEFGTAVIDGAHRAGAVTVMASSFFQFRAGAPAPSSLYAASKQALSVVADYYRDACGLDVRETVLFDTYGPGDTRDKLIPQLLSAAKTRTPVRVGSPAQPLDLTFVDDVVDGFIALAGPDAPARTAIRADAPATIGEVVTTLASIVGDAAIIDFDESARVNELPLVAGAWPRPPGWRARVSLRSGLEASLSEASAGSTAG